jgi:hypothetical protein
VDLNVKFKDIDLSPMTPYSGKYVGYKILLQVLGNLIAKAATSPFALIGAIMGGGEQVDLAKDLPNPEMEKLMLTNIVINEGDLRALASQRSARVREALAKSGVEGERLFIVEPKSLSPEKKDKVKDSRVDFRLK